MCCPCESKSSVVDSSSGQAALPLLLAAADIDFASDVQLGRE